MSAKPMERKGRTKSPKPNTGSSSFYQASSGSYESQRIYPSQNARPRQGDMGERNTMAPITKTLPSVAQTHMGRYVDSRELRTKLHMRCRSTGKTRARNTRRADAHMHANSDKSILAEGLG